MVIEKYLPSIIDLLEEEKSPIYIGKGHKLNDQDIVKIVVVNLMPNKAETEKQILRVLSHGSLNTEVSFLRLETHDYKSTSKSYLEKYYKTLEEIKQQKIDGMIITGAPLEQVDLESIDYWEELQEIMDYSKEHISSTLFICWAAVAGLYHFYSLPKRMLSKKVFGVFDHETASDSELFKGLPQKISIPHSRYFEFRKEDIDTLPSLEVLSQSPESGLCVVGSKDKKQVFIAGHLEYDVNTLEEEYLRDCKKGLDIDIPTHYFKGDNPEGKIISNWGKESKGFYYNWLKYYVKKEDI